MKVVNAIRNLFKGNSEKCSCGCDNYEPLSQITSAETLQEVVEDCMAKFCLFGKSFTSFDVSKRIKGYGGFDKVTHRDVARIVRGYYIEQHDYIRTLITAQMPDGSHEFVYLYHHIDVEPIPSVVISPFSINVNEIKPVPEKVRLTLAEVIANKRAQGDPEEILEELDIQELEEPEKVRPTLAEVIASKRQPEVEEETVLEPEDPEESRPTVRGYLKADGRLEIPNNFVRIMLWANGEAIYAVAGFREHEGWNKRVILLVGEENLDEEDEILGTILISNSRLRVTKSIIDQSLECNVLNQSNIRIRLLDNCIEIF